MLRLFFFCVVRFSLFESAVCRVVTEPNETAGGIFMTNHDIYSSTKSLNSIFFNVCMNIHIHLYFKYVVIKTKS